MQRFLLILCVSLLASCAPGRSTIQTLNGTALATHRTVAILPFEVEQDRLLLDDINYAGTDTTLATQQRIKQEWAARQQQKSRQIAYQLQELLYAQLEAQKPSRGYTVQFQEVRETNRLLQQAGITYENFPDHTLKEVQQALGVDAVLSGQTMLYQAMPGIVGLAARLMVNEPLVDNQQSIVPISQATTSLMLYDCRANQLAWRLDFERAGNVALNPARLAQDLVRAALSDFPYCRK
ncbi:hypothetical protein [Hymenobacter sp.]|uniref:hypothetical protein n=1 Tax=Hymenobacter sp. TaxID=1898978 RepID=UPI002ED98BFB